MHLRVLQVEDSEDDAFLMEEVFRAAGIPASFQRVDNGPTMDACLSRSPFDVVVCDHRMPRFDAFQALEVLRTRAPHIPLIVASGHIGEETAIELIHRGASDYVLKDRMGRLPHAAVAAVERARMKMEAERSHLALEATERRFRALALELERLNQMKRDLIQTLSHELFTPITLINGVATMMAEPGANPASIASLSGEIASASQRLRHLVQNIQLAASLDADHVEPRFQEVALGDLVTSAMREFSDPASRLSVAHIDDVWIWADPVLAAGAMAILLENALELSAEVVEVRTRSQGGSHAYVEVADRGPGISEADRRLVFQSFTQADTSLTREHQGLGLGLYLAERIMRMHRGRVGVREREGGGSIFTLAFPVALSGSTLREPRHEGV